MTPEPGSQVRVVMSKWGERPHWELDAVYLGRDDHGDWLGIPAGTRMSRPGATYVAPTDQVGLAPVDGPEEERGWLATFHAADGPVRVYVDITTPPVWVGPELRAVDLDLDVVSEHDGRAWVDDEDEFADHRVRLGYPDELARSALASCARVHAAVAAGDPPYDGTAEAWLTRVGSLHRP